MALSDEQFVQLVLVGGPILSLIGTWMSLRAYATLKQQKTEKKVPTESPEDTEETP